MKKPRITGHQLLVLYGIENFEKGHYRYVEWYLHPISCTNEKCYTVCTFKLFTISCGFTSVKGNPRTGASLLAKGLIEPAGSMVHDGSYVNWPNAEVTFYRLTELGKSYL
ncbi:hypothetical protein MKK42_21785 [Escherichia coli]|uniref:hypothetical protein n=1 Tax=Escherichia coli TaxID=562 RepID=UPI001F5719A7|nr:hypothetical protein [Escherichia coli]MCI2234704.1 hypothetical protein [Escherichia coli]